MKINVALSLFTLMLIMTVAGHGAGTLQPVGSPDAPIQIQDHHVQVLLNNGFAQTTVTQTFYNPNPLDLEAIYSFPLPTSASLSEVVVTIGEKELHGEVVAKGEANRIYEEERDSGNEAAVANKDGYAYFEFKVSPVRAQQTVRIAFVYYQPLTIDSGICRYLYPLEEGGTDDAADQFWTRNQQVEQTLTIDVEIKSSWPLADVRIPGYGDAATIEELGEGHHRAHIELQQASLDRDLVVYYRLADNLPGRVEMLTYRPNAQDPGTFMMIVTPGIDLRPLDGGADYVFILDVSGSMDAKIATLAEGVGKALGKLRPQDTFRVVTFNDRAGELVSRRNATPEQVGAALALVRRLKSGGSTNLFDGIREGLRGIDADRATSIVLVTDGVTNTGIVDPRDFHKLMTQVDVRVFGFLMGNSANWPLMRTICDASGGFYAGISNNDDIIGQLLLAQSKVTHASLHDATLRIRGGDVYDCTDEWIGKVYRGQQLVIFGRYRNPGPATLSLQARLTGETKSYTTTFDFPETDLLHPELERLWALHRIETIEARRDAGLEEPAEAKQAIRDLGLAAQLVTDETSMLVLSDAAFSRHGLERHNRDRVARERQAQAVRSQQPPANHRVDSQQPAFNRNAPRLGGGALDPMTVLAMLLLAIGTLSAASRERRQNRTR